MYSVVARLHKVKSYCRIAGRGSNVKKHEVFEQNTQIWERKCTSQKSVAGCG